MNTSKFCLRTHLTDLIKYFAEYLPLESIQRKFPKHCFVLLFLPPQKLKIRQIIFEI
jgi:hypothetical protein